MQKHYGYLTDEALEEGAGLLGMTPLELEEMATFYDFIYREPVGKYVIHVCDGVICWMLGHQSVLAYICRKTEYQVGRNDPRRPVHHTSCRPVSATVIMPRPC